MTIREAIWRIVSRKIKLYNAAREAGRNEQASEYFCKLQGMQEVLQAIGINMYLKNDADFNLVCDLEVNRQ